MSEQPPAGFYADPEDPSRQRWWDGVSWGEQWRAAPPPVADAPAVPQPVAAEDPEPPVPPAPVAVEAAPAGFYADPDDEAILRWWDGERWTEQRQARPPLTTTTAQVLSLLIVVLALACVLAGLVVLAGRTFG